MLAQQPATVNSGIFASALCQYRCIYVKKCAYLSYMHVNLTRNLKKKKQHLEKDLLARIPSLHFGVAMCFLLAYSSRIDDPCGCCWTIRTTSRFQDSTSCYQVSTKSIFDVIDFYAHVKRTRPPQIPHNVVEQTYLPVEKVLNFRCERGSHTLAPQK